MSDAPMEAVAVAFLKRKKAMRFLSARKRPRRPSVDEHGLSIRRLNHSLYLDTAEPRLEFPDPGKRDRLMARFPHFAAMALEALDRDKDKARSAARQRARAVLVNEREQWGDAARSAEPGADFGPGHQHKATRGPATHDLSARLIIEEVRERLDGKDSQGRPKYGPEFKRARVADPLARLAARGDISERQHAAAECLLDALEQASGGLGSPVEGLRITVEPWMRTNLNQRQYAGYLAVRACLVALSAPELRFNLIPVVAWCVVQAGTLGGFTAAYRLKPGTAGDMLRHALDLIAGCFALPDDAVPRAIQQARAEEVLSTH